MWYTRCGSTDRQAALYLDLNISIRAVAEPMQAECFTLSRDEMFANANLELCIPQTAVASTNSG